MGSAPNTSLKALAATLLVAISACGTDPGTGALLQLVPDERYNTEAEVASQLGRIQLLFDAETGFAGITGGQPPIEGFTTFDLDGDGQLELLLEIQVTSRDQLPVLRLDPGSNQERSIAIRALGFDPQAQVAAYGGIEPRRLFVPGELSTVEVPFNLARSHLAPTILAVAPREPPVVFGLGSLAFYASRPLDRDSLAGHVRVALVGGLTGEKAIEGTISGPRSCPFGVEMWTFNPTRCHDLLIESAHIDLVLDPEVTDTQGAGLIDDQGNPGFHFRTEGKLMSKFGPCASIVNCNQTSQNSPQIADLLCDASSGLLEPADCTIEPAGCLGDRVVFSVARTDNGVVCRAFRGDTQFVDTLCVPQNPWPCTTFMDCSGIATGQCEGTTHQCAAEPCVESCSDPLFACVPERGCLPALGGCAEDCQAYGGCPSLEQHCTLRDSGVYGCE